MPNTEIGQSGGASPALAPGAGQAGSPPADPRQPFFDPNWRQLLKLHSTWVALLWTIVTAAYAALPAFMEYVSPQTFFFLCLGFCVALLFARLTNQPGVSL